MEYIIKKKKKDEPFKKIKLCKIMQERRILFY